jgi:hypothetical protein
MEPPTHAPEPSTLSRGWAPVCAATVASVVVLALRLAALLRVHRLPDADELHTLINARVLLAGEALPPSIGLLTPYEGGSWLIAWPTSWALALGLNDVQASGYAAACVALLTVALSSLWLGRLAGWGAALAVGPLVAFTSPQLGFYSIRAWGSLPEALVALPALAFAGAWWIRRDRPLPGAAAIGLLLAGAIILSYLHMLTALAFVFIQAVEAREGARWRRAAVETAVVAAVALGAWAAWLVVSSHGDAGWPTVRDGRSLTGALGPLLAVRLDRVLVGLPRAWYGHLPGFGARELVAGLGLSGLGAAAAVVLWRRGGPSRWPVIWCAVLVPGLSVGLWMGGATEAPRYYIPLLAGLLALVAAWDLRASAVAVGLGLLLWWPSPPRAGPESVDLAHVELGAFGLVSDSAEPHGRFLGMFEQVEPWHRSAFAFGYGVDAGRRGFPVVFGDRPAAGRARDGLHFGLGCGLLSDGALEDEELDRLREVRTAADRIALLEGMGAVIALRHELGAEPHAPTRTALARELSGFDWEALGRGSAQLRRGVVLPADVVGLELGGERAAALGRGHGARDPVRDRRVRLLMAASVEEPS